MASLLKSMNEITWDIRNNNQSQPLQTPRGSSQTRAVITLAVQLEQPHILGGFDGFAMTSGLLPGLESDGKFNG